MNPTVALFSLPSITFAVAAAAARLLAGGGIIPSVESGAVHRGNTNVFNSTVLSSTEKQKSDTPARPGLGGRHLPRLSGIFSHHPESTARETDDREQE